MPSKTIVYEKPGEIETLTPIPRRVWSQFFTQFPASSGLKDNYWIISGKLQEKRLNYQWIPISHGIHWIING